MRGSAVRPGPESQPGDLVRRVREAVGQGCAVCVRCLGLWSRRHRGRSVTASMCGQACGGLDICEWTGVSGGPASDCLPWGGAGVHERHSVPRNPERAGSALPPLPPCFPSESICGMCPGRRLGEFVPPVTGRGEPKPKPRTGHALPNWTDPSGACG